MVRGVGNKNFRWDCHRPKYFSSEKKLSSQMCSTHPHQTYFELLSEHGLFGTILILLIFYNLIVSKNLKDLNKESYLHKGSLIYLFLIFLPIIPSGSFFSDHLLTILAINLSIFYGSSKKLNIFKGNK